MSPTATATDLCETALRTHFGPEALITQVGAVWLVHLDQPSATELAERHAEIERDLLERDDCALCDELRPQAGDTVICDGPMCLIEPAPWRKAYPDLDEGEPGWPPQLHAS
jgi:hypothetical protein